jgi:hypothetical protein
MAALGIIFTVNHTDISHTTREHTIVVFKLVKGWLQWVEINPNVLCNKVKLL